LKHAVVAVFACTLVLLAYAGTSGAARGASSCVASTHSITLVNHVVGGPPGVQFHIELRRIGLDGADHGARVVLQGDYTDGGGFDDVPRVWADCSRDVVVSTSTTDPAANLDDYETTIDCEVSGVDLFVGGRTLDLETPPGGDVHIACTVTNTFAPGAGGAPTHVPQGPDRFIYCSVAGDTDQDGNPLVPGTSLNLLFGQPLVDAHYTGATPGFWIPGVGVTCSLTPQQAALAAASSTKVNHVGGHGDVNQPEVYTLVG
jgi:hypothetical protein